MPKTLELVQGQDMQGDIDPLAFAIRAMAAVFHQSHADRGHSEDRVTGRVFVVGHRGAEVVFVTLEAFRSTPRKRPTWNLEVHTGL